MRRTSPARPAKTRRTAAARAAALLALLGAGLAGCTDLRDAARLEPEGVNVESPAAGVVAAAEARPYAYPTFRDVPAKVADLRPATGYAQAVGGLTHERASLLDWQAANPEIVSGTEGYASETRAGARSGPGADPAPQADQTQRTTDWARRAREAAQAPPSAAPKP